MNFDYVYVRGHIEVFDDRGTFILSADTMAEARQEIEKMLVVKT